MMFKVCKILFSLEVKMACHKIQESISTRLQLHIFRMAFAFALTYNLHYFLIVFKVNISKIIWTQIRPVVLNVIKN